ncbi:MAG: hypothetical protein PHE84_15180 [bacterium]|nr:hypothetical protein [bacterium]
MTRVLLTSVFKPCAVDNAYTRKEIVPDTFHNQLTRYQGVFSLRERQYSHQLHIIAANLEHPVTVLDWPTLERYEEELKQGYDYVGISFIQPTFLKAKKMVETARELSPRSQVIIGGFGTMIEDIESILAPDHVCQGEGIGFLRKLLGEPEEFCFRHPLLETYEFLGTMGLPARFIASLYRILGIYPHGNGAGVIVTGVGCAEGCDFCSSGQFFTPRRISFLRGGAEIFHLMERYERELKFKNFLLIGDENFFSDPARLEELHARLQAAKKYYPILLSFGSANHLSRLDPRFLSELGIEVVWIGVESKFRPYRKNAGADLPRLVRELHRYGIKTVLSSILCFDEHTRENIGEDIDWHLSLNPTFSQFAHISPAQGTALWRKYQAEGRILNSIPLEDRHGFKQIWFKHPHFSLRESEAVQRRAYEKDYAELGPGFVRWIRVNYEAYPNLLDSGSEMLRRRAEAIKSHMGHYRLLLRAAEMLAPTGEMEGKIRELRKEIEKDFGRIRIDERVLAAAFGLLGKGQELKTRYFSDVIQPRTIVRDYN